jgi:hypothetical protein
VKEFSLEQQSVPQPYDGTIKVNLLSFISASGYDLKSRFSVALDQANLPSIVVCMRIQFGVNYFSTI